MVRSRLDTIVVYYPRSSEYIDLAFSGCASLQRCTCIAKVVVCQKHYGRCLAMAGGKMNNAKQDKLKEAFVGTSAK